MPVITKPTPADVHALVPQRAPGGFSTDTVPTLAEVSDVIDRVTQEVSAGLPAVLSTEQNQLAMWAITLGAAGTVETAVYPEQQDQGAAATLFARYREVLARLRAIISGEGDLAVQHSTVRSVQTQAPVMARQPCAASGYLPPYIYGKPVI